LVATAFTFAAAGDFELGEADPAFGGRWAIQVNSTTQTITPQLSLDRVNWFNRAVTPSDNSADVATITGTGIWILDALACFARLHVTGAGATSGYVRAAVG
jgi:hypothetical protein